MAIQQIGIEGNTGIIRFGSLKDLELGKHITGDKMNRVLFNGEKPTHLSNKMTRVWTSTSRFYPKFYTRSTVGSKSGNYVIVSTSEYTWDKIGDLSSYIRITTDTDAIPANTALIDTGFIGQGGKEFVIELDSNIPAINSIMSTENNNFNLIITSDGMAFGQNYRYYARIQASNENAGIPVDYLKADKLIREQSSTIPTFGTPSAPGLGRMGSAIRLKNVVGNYGREFTLDEHFVRASLEKQNNMTGLPTNNGIKQSQWSFDPTDLVNGAVFAFPGFVKDEVTGEYKSAGLQNAGWVSFFEMKVEDTIDMDREWMAHFGKPQQLQTTTNPTNVNTTVTQWYVAAGLRELMKLGHYKTHNGSIDVEFLQDYLTGVYMTRVDEIDRRTTFRTGSLGRIFLNQMVNTAAQGYFGTVRGDQFITSDNSHTSTKAGGSNNLQFGYQFTRWIGLNGVEVTMEYDQMLDDPTFCMQRYTQDSTYTIDSARMEIYDFGHTNYATKSAEYGEGGTQNCSMILRNDMDRKHWRIGALHPYTGWLQRTESDDTTSKYTRKKSGSPVIWDTSKVGAIVYDPLV